MRIEIVHTTRFDYDRIVKPLDHLLYMRPADTPLLRVHRFHLGFTPSASVQWIRDDFDNLVASARFSSDSSVLEIHATCALTTSDLPPFEFLVRDYARQFPFAYEPLHYFNLGIYFNPSQATAHAPLRRWIAAHFAEQPQDTVAWLFALNRTVHQHLTYERRTEPGIQKPLTTLELGSGSCRDYAAFFVECARALGLAARFVSGYRLDLASDQQTPGDMHAWAEVFLPGAGWRGLDPTSGIFCDNTYVPVAHAVVPESVNPVQGSFSSDVPASSRLTASVRLSVAPSRSDGLPKPPDPT